MHVWNINQELKRKKVRDLTIIEKGESKMNKEFEDCRERLTERDRVVDERDQERHS